MPRAGIILLAGLICVSDVKILDASEHDTDTGEHSVRGPMNIGAIPPELLETARRVQHQPLPQRMKLISDQMLGRDYLLDPLGEGRLPDLEPTARYDSFDCLTFLEEVLALSLSGEPSHASFVRLSLRYGEGPVEYTSRHHHMELQWIPSAIQLGWLRDATSDYGEYALLTRNISVENWNTWAGRKSFTHQDDELPVGLMRLRVLTLDQAETILPTIKPGTIVLTVRENRPWKPLWISHASFVLPQDGRPMLRHATKVRPASVRDVGFANYIRSLRTYKNWKAVGISLLEPIEQGPRRSALPSASAPTD